MMKSMKSGAIAILAIGASGCASIVSDNQSTTYIETDPEEARCELHGQDFKRVVNTPNSIHLPAEAAPITIACSAAGYRTTTQPLDTEIDGWILGNIIFGGIIGVAIDAARDAGEQYPAQVTVLLEPEVFASENARDEWFDRRKRAVEAQFEEQMEIAETQCAGGTDCVDRKEKLTKARDEKLAEIEERRLRAKIRGPGQADT